MSSPTSPSDALQRVSSKDWPTEARNHRHREPRPGRAASTGHMRRCIKCLRKSLASCAAISAGQSNSISYIYARAATIVHRPFSCPTTRLKLCIHGHQSPVLAVHSGSLNSALLRLAHGATSRSAHYRILFMACVHHHPGQACRLDDRRHAVGSERVRGAAVAPPRPC